MRNFTKLGITVVLMVATANAFASNMGGGNLSKGKRGLSVSTSSNTMLSGKYFVGNEKAVLVGFGLLNNAAGTDIYLMGGGRKYFSSNNTTNVVPFIGGRGWYSSLKSANASTLGASAEAGAEYFFEKNFSIEGLVSLGFASTTPSGGSSTSTFGTSLYALGANFYF